MKHEGLDPTLGAVLPLAGVIVGALLGGLLRAWLDHRAELRRFRAAALLMLDDLHRIGSLLMTKPTGIEHLDAEALEWLRVEVWPETRMDLAAGLNRRPAVWDTVRYAVLSSRVLRRLILSHATNPRTDDALRLIHTQDETLQRVKTAIGELSPYVRDAGPFKVDAAEASTGAGTS